MLKVSTHVVWTKEKGKGLYILFCGNVFFQHVIHYIIITNVIVNLFVQQVWWIDNGLTA